MFDLIRVTELEIWSRVGVPDEEREEPQRLLVDLELRVKDIGPASLTDNVKLTVDYAVVAERVKTLALSRPRRLVETLAEDIAADLLKMFPITSLQLEIKKFVLPDARHVAIIIERPKGGRSAAVFRPGHSTSLRMSRNVGPDSD
jgi:dihydroneopterin aldolase